MIETEVATMLLYTKNNPDHAYVLNGRAIKKVPVFIKVPTETPNGSGHEITILGNDRTYKITGKFRIIRPSELAFSFPDYSFSIENSIISFNNMKLDKPRKLNIMSFDTEVGTTGEEPSPATNKIITIGYAINDSEPEVLYLSNSASDDRQIIKKFLDIIDKNNVDVIVGYYSGGFDLPFILRRAYILGMEKDILTLCRKGRILEEKMKRTIYFGDDVGAELGTVLHHDLYNEARMDQSLYKLKHRTLKEVAKHFFGDRVKALELEKEVLINMLRAYDTDRNKIIEYQLSDVEATRKLAIELYTRRVIEQANEMGIPLNVMFRRTPSLLLQVEIMRKMVDEGLFVSCKNSKRFHMIYARANERGSNKPYQGAWTEAFRRGKYDNVHKYDYSGMYTSIIMTLNMSYETVTLEKIKQGVTGQSSSIEVEVPEDNPDDRLVTVHDMNQESDITVRISMNPIGFIPRMLLNIKKTRMAIKEKMKRVSKTSDEYHRLDSKQLMMKVMGNSVYGILSNREMPGWLPIGIVTTAFGRHIAAKLIEILEKEIGKDSILELDSVTGDTPIWVKDQDGNIDIVPIRDLHSSDRKREQYTGNYKVLTRNGWADILYTKKHVTSKDIHRIKLSDGYVDVTSDHSLFDANTLKEVRPCDITPKKDRIETLNIEIKPSGNKPDGYMPMDKDFWWLIGFIVAKGSVTEQRRRRGNRYEYRRQVSINGNDRQLMEKACWIANNYLGKQFGTKFRLYDTMKSSGVYKVEGGCNAKIYTYLKHLIYTADGRYKKVPKVVLNNPVELGKPFLEGLMDGNGHKAITSGRRVESVGTKSKTLAAGVQYILHCLGTKTRINIRKDKNNITTVADGFKWVNPTTGSKAFKNIDTNLVLQNRVISNNVAVYDIATSDGTFVTALGNIVLHNTDGVIVSGKADINKVNKEIKEYISNLLSIDISRIQIEIEEEEYDRIFIHKAKNYIIKDKEGNVIIHGSAMKSSKLPKVMDRFVELLIQYGIEDKISKEELITRALDIENLPVDYFITQTRLSRDLSSYKTDTDIVRVARQLAEKKIMNITRGTNLQTVMVKDPLSGVTKPVAIQMFKDGDSVDYEYYKDMIRRMLEEMEIITSDKSSESIGDMIW